MVLNIRSFLALGLLLCLAKATFLEAGECNGLCSLDSDCDPYNCKYCVQGTCTDLAPVRLNCCNDQCTKDSDCVGGGCSGECPVCKRQKGQMIGYCNYNVADDEFAPAI